MDEEEGSDKHLRGTFGAKWNRTKSEDLNKKFREQAKKYQVYLVNVGVSIYLRDGVPDLFEMFSVE